MPPCCCNQLMEKARNLAPDALRLAAMMLQHRLHQLF
ncbi:hypothetical protein EPIR_1360 [Erwinia piriflorinigrans CFBP 5888]|uniref:Uncharacterized protein n=1 Tax=Erwinia piriflorinigrans CFBP 5888 TaxID=1161919 RepID=V5Z6S2_9GAMM|nr:hypothetical protein EPIR_1360 [Erwinia piriflorinigrans CFBP 5888]